MYESHGPEVSNSFLASGECIIGAVRHQSLASHGRHIGVGYSSLACGEGHGDVGHDSFTCGEGHGDAT